MDGSGQLFSRFAKELAPFVSLKTVIYPATQPMDYAQLLDFVLDRLPTEGNYAVLAESFSGPVGIELAARAPRGLKKLILCCTFAPSPRRSLRCLLPLLPVLPLQAMPLSLAGRALMGRCFEPGLQAEFVGAMRQLSADVMRVRAKAVLAVDVLARLQAVKVPTLYLQASRDQIVPSSAAELILAARSDVQLHRIDGPHFLLQTNPVESAQAVRRFLST